MLVRESWRVTTTVPERYRRDDSEFDRAIAFIDATFAVALTLLVTTLDIKSDPTGARVLVDGKSAGVSPIVIPEVKPGSHVVTIEGPNGSIRQVVQVAAGATASVLVPW